MYGYEATIRTDNNQPIIGILKNKRCEGGIAKYLSTILMYKIEYIYLPGKHNVVADFLSRSCEEGDKIREKFKVNAEDANVKINIVNNVVSAID